MEITLVEFMQQEQYDRLEEIQLSSGCKPTEVHLFQSLKKSTELLFPGLNVKEIARAKKSRTLIVVLVPFNTTII